MSDIEINCPYCQQTLEVPEDLMGEIIDCPSCNRSIALPDRNLSPTPPATHQSEPLQKDCPFCGERILLKAKKCKHCGEILDRKLRAQRERLSAPQVVQIERPPKSRSIYIILGLFLGGLFGVHNFYARRYLPAVIQLAIILTLGWIYIGVIINAIWVFVELFAVTEDGTGNAMK